MVGWHGDGDFRTPSEGVFLFFISKPEGVAGVHDFLNLVAYGGSQDIGSDAEESPVSGEEFFGKRGARAFSNFFLELVDSVGYAVEGFEFLVFFIFFHSLLWGMFCGVSIRIPWVCLLGVCRVGFE